MLVESGKRFAVRYEVFERQRKEQKNCLKNNNLHVFFFGFVDFFPSYVPCTASYTQVGINLKVLLTEFIWISKDMQKTKVLEILDINKTEESLIYKFKWK